VRIVDPPQPRIFESWSPYTDFFHQDQRGWTVPHVDKIKNLAVSFDFVLANCSTEHWGSERDFPLVARLHDLLAEHYAKDFVCLCHDPSDQELRSGIMYFPFYAWRQLWNPVDPVRIAKADRHYLFSNLNHRARDFRIANYLWWQQQAYRDRCFISLYDAVQDHDYDGHFALTEAESVAWQQIRPQLSDTISDGFGEIFDCTHPAFADTYLHVVSETTVKDKIFITEKTWQTILAGQLFTVWGNAGTVSHLRDLGVDVFDDIINHDYDAINDHRNRLDQLHQELDRLSELDWSEIYALTHQRRLNNAKKFAAGTFISAHLDKLKQKLPKGVL